MIKYTVVGIYPDTDGEESYVEWVVADNPLDAIDKACELDVARSRAERHIVAIFEGHHTDVGPNNPALWLSVRAVTAAKADAVGRNNRCAETNYS